ncbi:Ig-like domain-containing protein [candidate division KSB1 bacterium]
MNRFTTNIIPAGLILTSLYLSGCGHKLPPPGGEVDIAAPTLESVTPADGALNVPRNTDIVLEFSEWMTERTVEPNFHISPPIRDYSFRWSGRSFILKPDNPLAENTTYTILLGAGATDRNRVALGKPLTAHFCTGDRIPNTTLSGRVAYKDKMKDGAYVWLYDLDREPEPDPREDIPPHYLAVTDTSGNFRVSHINPGRYRLLGFLDSNRSFLYDPREPIGAAFPDAQVYDSSVIGGIRIFMEEADLEPPGMSNVRPLNRDQVEVSFNEALDNQNPPTPDNFRFLPDDPAAAVPSITWFLIHPDDHRITMGVTGQVREVGYEFIAGGLRDLWDNVSAADTAFFIGSGRKDDVPPRVLAVEPLTNATDVPLATGLKIWFNEPMDSATVRDGLHLRRLRDSVQVAVTVERTGLGVFQLTLAESLGDSTAYQLEADSVIADRSGNLLGAPFASSFRTVNSPDRGTLLGGVILPDSLLKNPVMVQAVSTASVPREYQVAADSINAFRFEDLPARLYTVRAYVDRDGNGKWDRGNFFTGVPPEPLGSSADTIRVRPGRRTDPVTIRIEP